MINNIIFFIVDQLIDLKIMALMRVEHVYKLLEKFPLGNIILFESELLKWQKNTSISDTIVISNVSNAIVNSQVGVENSSKKTFEL